jgi:hypothetical protein
MCSFHVVILVNYIHTHIDPDKYLAVKRTQSATRETAIMDIHDVHNVAENPRQ